MKPTCMNFLIIIPMYLASPMVAAVTDNTDIDTACKKHSIQIVKSLKEQIITDMSREEIGAALAIARRSCFDHFGDLPAAESVARTGPSRQTEQEPENRSTGNDWFSKYVLEGNPHEKEGVKRLKKRNH